MKINVENLRDKIQAVTDGMGFELAELSAPVVGGRLILRVFIHSPQGVTIADCTRVSHALSDMLDADDLVDKRFTLEVSSLGLDRPLVTPRDFTRRVGEKVRVIYDSEGVEKTVEGILTYSDGADIKIDIGGETVAIPVDAKPRGKIVI